MNRNLLLLASSAAFVTLHDIARAERHGHAVLLVDAPPRIPEVTADDLLALVRECEETRQLSIAANMEAPYVDSDLGVKRGYDQPKPFFMQRKFHRKRR